MMSSEDKDSNNQKEGDANEILKNSKFRIQLDREVLKAVIKAGVDAIPTYLINLMHHDTGVQKITKHALKVISEQKKKKNIRKNFQKR